MNKSENIYGKNWIFVGNTSAIKDDIKKLSQNRIKYKLGEVAYDIHGVKISKNYMLPLFIAKESYQKYDDIMMAELSRIRNG